MVTGELGANSKPCSWKLSLFGDALNCFDSTGICLSSPALSIRGVMTVFRNTTEVVYLYFQSGSAVETEYFYEAVAGVDFVQSAFSVICALM